MNINSCTFGGYLAADPESRTFNGGSVTSFLLINNSTKGQSEKKIAIKCQCWGKTGEIAAQYLAKGCLVGVTGTLYEDEWQDRDGNQRKTLVLDVRELSLPPKAVNESRLGGRGGYKQDYKQDYQQWRPQGNYSSTHAQQPAAFESPADDDMPF